MTGRRLRWWAASVLLLLLVVVATLSLRYQWRPESGALAVPATVLAQLRAGDLVFRTGTEPISDSVRLVDGGGFSHVGLLIGQPGHWQVLHAVPSERADRKDAVVVDELAFYLDRVRSRRAGFYRVDAAKDVRRAAVAWARTRIGLPFRIDPLAATTTSADATYCTTLIDDAYRHAGFDLQAHFRRLQLPLISGDYLLPSALRASPHLQLVYDTRNRAAD